MSQSLNPTAIDGSLANGARIQQAPQARTRKTVRWAAAAAALLIVCFIGRAVYLDYFGGKYLAPEFGFRLETPMLDFGGRWMEVTELHHVAIGGHFERAGFRTGDILADDLAPYQLFRALLRTREGESVKIAVLRGPEGASLDAYERHEILVTPISR
jgi:hypothetical protein